MKTKRTQFSLRQLRQVLILAFALTPAIAPSARGQCQYEITEVISSPGVSVNVKAMNEHGHIVGYLTSWGPDTAFLWTSEDGLVTLPKWPGSSESRAYDINDAGNIVGYIGQINPAGYTACMWKDGEAIDLGYLPDGDESVALGINRQSQVVGYSNHGTYGPTRAFLWNDGEMTDLSAVINTEHNAAYAINDRCQVTGWMGTWMVLDSRAFILEDDVVKELHDLPGGMGANGHAVNERGWVAGVAYLELPVGPSLGRHAFAYAKGAMVDLSPLPGDIWSFAHDINLRSQVVGSSDDGGWVYRAVLWQNGKTTELTDLIPPDSGLAIQIAGAINDAGQIAASAFDSMNNKVGVLLTPSETVPGDVDGNCSVDIDDLFAILGFWGPCEGCPEDLNQDGVANTLDLLIVIMNWG